MGFFDRFLKAKSEPIKDNVVVMAPASDEPEVKLNADFNDYSQGYGRTRNLVTVYNGEKNLGEVGPIKTYILDYEGLRRRSWQAYLESELAQILMNKFSTWTLGGGLKLQSEPSTKALKLEGIDIDKNFFSESVEARFAIFCESKESIYSGMGNLYTAENEAFVNSRIGGDCLVVLRYENKNVNVQVIDGAHVMSPMMYGNDTFPQFLPNGNRIIQGVELSPRNEQVSYYVRKNSLNVENNFSFEVERVAAKGSNGLTMAYLVKGMKYRLNNYRGIPYISGVLETLKKLERYKEATVGSAEERQKIAYFFEHTLGSTGESPLLENLKKSWQVSGAENVSNGNIAEDLAQTVSKSTNKQTFNMPVNSTVKALDSKNELYFESFYNVNTDIICAVFEMPPNVAMSKYDSNFSASRAALKDWELVLNVTRKKFSREFWQPIYDFWLEIQILSNKIQAPGYIIAKRDKNTIVLGAYRKARFVGPAVPHIDPLKEVNAERAKLGDMGKNYPLTTAEAATERLNEGDSDANMQQFASEIDRAKGFGIDPSVSDNSMPPNQA